MFNGLSSSPTDLFNLSIPILKEPSLRNSYKVDKEFVEIYGNRIATVIASYTENSQYLDWLDWDNVYIMTFPRDFMSVPAIIYSNMNSSGICINDTLATVKRDVKKDRIVVDDPSNFALCATYGLNKLILNDVDDEEILGYFYKAFCTYIYVLLMRLYANDFDLRNYPDQDLAMIFYSICKLVASKYLYSSGNLHSLAVGTTLDFFVKKQKSTSLRSVRIDQSKFPSDYDFGSYTGLFKYFEASGLLPGITLHEFSIRLMERLSNTILTGLGSGFEFGAMLCSAKLASDVFPERIVNVYPPAVSMCMKAIRKHMIQTKKPKSDFYLDKQWDEGCSMERFYPKNKRFIYNIKSNILKKEMLRKQPKDDN